MTLDQAMPRTLLCLLALHAGEPVSVDTVIDVLWDLDAPKTSRNLIQVYIGRLRRLLDPRPGSRSGRWMSGTGGPIRLVAAGYLLDPALVSVDLARFNALFEQATQAQTVGDQNAAAAWYLDALRCWRGPVLAGAEQRLRHHPVVVRLTRRRIDAALAYADLALPTTSEEGFAHLHGLAVAEPLHEGLHARLIRFLTAAGERAAAIRTFNDLRDRLVEQLGVSPGPEVMTAYLAVLRDPVPSRVAEASGSARTGGRVSLAPAQLPGAVPGFVGRERALRLLDQALSNDGAGVPIVVVTGPPGVGKTALAVHWGQNARRRFPDGQLYVNLRGYSPATPVRSVVALAGFLRALGVPPEQVPITVDEAASLYRSLLADRRMLILLDNARDAEHVRPLLPGASTCAVVVTSRDALGGLVAVEGARRLPVEVLAPDEAGEMLVRLLGPDRIAAATEAAGELVRLCGHLPLALRIAAANLTRLPDRELTEYVAELRTGDRLAALAIAGDPDTAVRATFQLSYGGRAPVERLLFRRMGLLPGSDVTAPAAAALAGLEPEQATEALARLATAHLVEEYSHNRYGLHDLLRWYANDLSERDDPPDERNAARDRLYAYYLRATNGAADVLYPHMLRLPRSTVSSPGWAPEIDAEIDAEVADPARASAWLDAERANLVAAVTGAAEQGRHDVTWSLADALRGYFFFRVPTVDWLTVATAATNAAMTAAQPAAQAAAQLSLAGLYSVIGHHGLSIDHFRTALALAERADWPAARVCVLGNMGAVYADQGHLEDAVTHVGEAARISVEIGWENGQQINLANLGEITSELGRLTEAVGHLEQALAINRRLGHRAAEANTMANLGKTQHAMGDIERAASLLSAALALHREVGNQGGEADSLQALAAVVCDQGDLDWAAELAREALRRADHAGHGRLEADARNTLGTILVSRGDAAAGIHEHEQALAIAEVGGYRYTRAQALVGLAAAHRANDQPDDAVAAAERALDLARRAGFRLLANQAQQIRHDIPDQAQGRRPRTL